MWANKYFLISSPFALGLLILNVVVWIGVYGAFTEQSTEAQELAPIAPNVEKSAPKPEETTAEDDPADRDDLAVFGMSVEDYAGTQKSFLEGLNASSKVSPWKPPYKPLEPPQRDD